MADPNLYDLFFAEDGTNQARALAEALRRKRGMGNLGLLTGDRVLSQYGQAQLQLADAQERALAGAGQEAGGNRLRKALQASQQQFQGAEGAKDRALRRSLAEMTLAGQMTRMGMTGGLKQADKERFAQKASKELVPFGDMANDLETVLKAAKSKDVAGVGPGAGYVPDFLTSPEGTENRRAARRLVENLLKAQSGLAASDREQLRKLASTSLADKAADADWGAGAAELARFVKKGMRNREAAFPPDVIAMLKERGHLTSENIPQAEESSATVKMLAPDGKTYEVDPAEAAEAEANGWKRAP